KVAQQGLKSVAMRQLAIAAIREAGENAHLMNGGGRRVTALHFQQYRFHHLFMRWAFSRPWMTPLRQPKSPSKG
ncbi:hypothetical protein ACUOA8_35285, partial [Escherichia sp. SS-MK2]